MESLAELARFIREHKGGRLSVVSDATRPEKLTDKLYQALADGSVTTDDEALAKFYPGNKSRKSLYKLKSTLRRRLMNTLLILDYSKTKISDHHKQYLECFSLLYFSTVLNGQTAQQTRTKFNERAKNIAAKNHLSTFSIEAGIAIHWDNSMTGNVSLAERSHQELINLSNLRHREVLLRSTWLLVGALSLKQSSQRDIVVPHIDSCFSIIDNLPPCPIVSFHSVSLEGMLRMARAMVVRDYEKAYHIGISTLDQVDAIDVIGKKNGKIAIALNLICCLIALRKSEEGFKYIDKFEENNLIAKQNGWNWYKFKQLHILLAIRGAEYVLAYNIYKELVDRPAFKKQRSLIKEGFALYGAYFHIIQSGGRLPKIDKPFRTQKFINEVPTFSKDKRGHNVPVLVAQFMISLLAQDFDRVIDRYEALNKYAERHLDKDKNYRANLFFRIIRAAVRANFVYAPFYAEALPYRARLDEIPPDVLDPTYDQEIVTYETLFNIICENLPESPHDYQERMRIIAETGSDPALAYRTMEFTQN